jgi:hypothetical protein
MTEEQKPYLIRETVIKNKEYNPEYGDDKKCHCGHPYYRHFDSWDDMNAVGCKYCECPEFVPTEPKDFGDVIFAITTVRHALNAGNRTIGYAKTFEDADQWVRENACSMDEEGYYMFAVIEPVEPGIYSLPRTEFWYRWNSEKEQYEPCGKPERFKQVVCWGLG